jgi:hypothetical protein
MFFIQCSAEDTLRPVPSLSLVLRCDVPPDRINEIEIPTGLPLVYNLKQRRIQLLETGNEDPADPIGHVHFGSSPQLLFKPCNDNAPSCYVGTKGKTYAWDPLIRLPKTIQQAPEAYSEDVAA